MKGEDWRDFELVAAIATYLDMLELELAGQNFNKSEKRRQLLSKLDGRTDSSVERRHQNISSAMKELGYPHIVGYKPLPNFRRDTLFPELLRQLAARGNLHKLALQAISLSASEPSIRSFDSVEVSPPTKTFRVREDTKDFVVEHTMKRDYLAQEARNQELGKAGEKFVLAYERWRLLTKGRDDLARKVVHSSEDVGDGLGFDISSFDETGEPRFIEVKTTAYSGETPFFISSNELRFSNANPHRFQLYRVFAFRKAPKIYALRGRVDEHCHLDPVSYSAVLG